VGQGTASGTHAVRRHEAPLMIARAMMNEPRLLILDEPTAGVDIEIRRSMWQFISGINAAGTTVILTTHYLEEAEQLCRNIAIIDHGNIVENTTMKHLLSKLDVETFVLDVDNAPSQLPVVQGMTLRRVDEHTIEAEMPRTQALNTRVRGVQYATASASPRCVTKPIAWKNCSCDSSNMAAKSQARRKWREQPVRQSDRAAHHRTPRNRAHHAHLDANADSARDHHDAVLRHLRQAYRQPHRHDPGWFHLHAIHRAGAGDDEHHHQQLRQHFQLVLRRQVPALGGRDAGVADVQLGDPAWLCHGRWRVAWWLACWCW
jgi:ABC-type glutathione transport system ATPase component